MARRIWNNGAEGGTPLNATNLNAMEDDIEASLNLSRDYKLNVGTVGTGVAGASLGPKKLDNSQDLNLTLPALDTYGWIVACFLGNGESGEKLSLFYSPDGKTVFGGSQNPVYWADRLRDPSIVYWKDNFYVAYTLADGVGRNWRLIKSATGAPGSWSVVATVDVSALVPSGNKCWAPELVVNGADMYCFFTNTGTTTQTMGWQKATDLTGLTTWTAPVALTTSGFTTNYIDGVPIQYGSDWYFFSSGGSQIYRAKSTTGITGTYVQDRSGDWAGWGTGIEGPYVTKIGATYRIYYDRYVAGTGHWFSESSDLATWTAPQQVQAAPGSLPAGTKIRHGSFLQLPNMLAASKALAATTGSMGPATATFTHGKTFTPVTTQNFDGGTMVSDPVGVVRGLNGTGGFYVVQGGTYILTCDIAGTGFIGTDTRTFVEYGPASGARLARFGIQGGGEDGMTGSAVVVLAQDTFVQIKGFQNQGASKSMIVTTSLTRLGS